MVKAFKVYFGVNLCDKDRLSEHVFKRKIMIACLMDKGLSDLTIGRITERSHSTIYYHRDILKYERAINLDNINEEIKQFKEYLWKQN